jgi:hypothetical protein
MNVEKIRLIWKKLAPFALAASVLGVVGYTAAEHYLSDCCYPGAACCHPGAACCHGINLAKR